MFGKNVGYGLAGMNFPGAGQCLNCRRYNGDQKCDAFPAGIPEAVFDDVVHHTQPIDGDHGLQFEAAEPAQPLAVMVAEGAKLLAEDE